MKILAVGDIVGNSGVKKLKETLKEIKESKKIDFVIVNGENAGEGMGITEKNFKDIIEENVDVITMGNHTWGKKDIFKFINNPKLIRPANYCRGVPGKGYGIYEVLDKKIAVINLIGRVDVNVLSENPFLIARKIVEKFDRKPLTASIIINHTTPEQMANLICDMLIPATSSGGKGGNEVGMQLVLEPLVQEIHPMGLAGIV